MKKENKKKLLKENSLVMDLLRLGMISKLFNKYISGVSSPSENEIIEKWDAEKFWNKYRGRTDKSLIDEGSRKVWEHVTNQILVENPALERGNYTLISSKPVVTFRHFRIPYAAAAVLFILLGGGILFFTQHKIFNSSEYGVMADANTFLQTTDAQTRQVTLPDGSRIHLNRGTKISYASNAFNRRLREIWLEGEAFFEVAKNPEKPFIIHSGNLQTTVKGTSFNVKAYKEIGEINVSVRSGKVEVGTEDETFGLLTANKQLSYNEKTAKHTIAESNWEDAAAWKDHRLVLKNANIAELKLRIKQLYNIDLTVEGNILDNETFGLSFQQNAEFTDVMTVLEQLYDIKYRKTNTGQFSIYRH